MYVADELCDRVGFIVDGAVRLVDNPSELKVKMGKKLIKVEYTTNGEVSVKEFPLEKIGQNEEFLNILKNYEIRRINTEEPTLEEIFLKVTGRRLV